MQRYLTTIATVAVVLGALSSGGCLVPKTKLDRALLDNEKLKERLGRLGEDLHTAQKLNEDLVKVVKERSAIIEANQNEITLAKTEMVKIKKNFDDLKTMYDKEVGREYPVLTQGQLPIQVDRALRRFAQANPELMEYQPKYGMVKLKSDLSFASGSATVRAGATVALGKLVDILKTPEAEKLGVYIAGHTDNVPIGKPETRRKHPDNWYLSVHRAIGVQKVLKAAGLVPERIAVMGFGEYHPIAANRTSANGNKMGNETNRRVEIWIMPANQFLTASAEAEPSE